MTFLGSKQIEASHYSSLPRFVDPSTLGGSPFYRRGSWCWEAGLLSGLSDTSSKKPSWITLSERASCRPDVATIFGREYLQRTEAVIPEVWALPVAALLIETSRFPSEKGDDNHSGAPPRVVLSREEMIDLWLFSKLCVINEPAKIIIPDGTTHVVEIAWSWRARQFRVQILAPPFASCVTLRGELNHWTSEL